MCAQVPIAGLSHNAASNDALANDDAITSSILTTTATAHASTTVTAVLLAASAWLRLHTAPSNELSLRSECNDASGRHTDAKPILAIGLGLGLSVFRSNLAQEPLKYKF